MNPYDLDFSALKNEIINALIIVFGEEYASLILERFHSMYYVPYVNHDGMYAYYKFLMSCKSKMMAVKFLKIIGEDLSGYDIKSFADPLPKSLEIMCDGLIGGSYGFESIFHTSPVGCKSFVDRYSKNYSKDYIISNRIQFINVIRNNDINPVTLDNYNEFVGTDEYKKIEKLALYYTTIYEKLLVQMKKYLEDINEYQEYYNSEIERKKELLEMARINLYSNVEEGLQGPIRVKISDNGNINEKAKKLLSDNVGHKSNIEYFSSEDEEKLNNPYVSEFEKKWILIYRLSFFESIGIKVNVFEDDYYEVIKREGIKELIPSKYFCDELSRLRKRYFLKVENRFIKDSNFFKKTLASFRKDSVSDDEVYNILRDGKVCINSGTDSSKDFITIMYLTIRSWQCGCMDYVFIHELIHAIESVSIDGADYSCGFETEILNPKYSQMGHIEQKRKYERFNEVIVDLLAKEVVDLLHNKGCYILEDEKTTLSDFNHLNTDKILKDMVKPFYSKFRDLILDARLNGKLFLLTKYIGKDNFEELNRIVDYVDVLIENDLVSKLESNDVEDSVVVDYYIQLEKLEQLYIDIEEYYESIKNSFSKVNNRK